VDALNEEGKFGIGVVGLAGSPFFFSQDGHFE
jgi:hypothetical protein